MEEKTSLQRSHSGFSNFKLTLLSIFACLSFSCLWVFLAFLKSPDIPYLVSLIGSIVSGIVSFLCLIGLLLFRR